MNNRVDIEETVQETGMEPWVPKVLILGTVIGAVTGLAGAFLLVQRSKHDATPPTLEAKEGVRVGVLLLGLLRQVSLLGQND